MSKPDLYFPVYYIVKIQNDQFNVFNRVTDSAILQECNEDIVIDFLNINDPLHPFLMKEESGEVPPYGTSEWDSLWRSGVTSTYVGDKSFSDVFDELERTLSESLLTDYELSGSHYMGFDEGHPPIPYTYTFEYAAYRPETKEILVDATVKVGVQLELDFSPSESAPARVRTDGQNLKLYTDLIDEVDSFCKSTEDMRLQLQEDIFEEDEEDLEYLPED
jgi:hypothetical protein